MGFSRAAAPSKPGFGLLERKAAKRAKKNSVPRLRRSISFILCPRSHTASHSPTRKKCACWWPRLLAFSMGNLWSRLRAWSLKIDRFVLVSRLRKQGGEINVWGQDRFTGTADTCRNLSTRDAYSGVVENF